MGNTWTWKITVANGGNAPAAFVATQTLLTDNLPTSGLSYGAASVGNIVGSITNSGSIQCAIVSNTLNCTANGAAVTLAAGSSFDVSLTATPTAGGVFANPSPGGVCAADPLGYITESNENNNSCSDTVTVSVAGITLNATGIADGFRLSAFATGFPVLTVCNCGAQAASSTSPGKVLVTDYQSSNFYLFNDTDGQTVADALSVNSGFASLAGSALADSVGIVYLAVGRQLYTLNNDGTVNTLLFY